MFQKDHLDLLTKPPQKITWGNQEPLWKVKQTSNDQISECFERLALPKKNHASAQRVPIPHFEFSCGRSSPIRECRAPDKATCSKRLTELSKHRNRSGDINHQTFEFSCGRTSPIWKVSQVYLLNNIHITLLKLISVSKVRRLVYSCRDSCSAETVCARVCA